MNAAPTLQSAWKRIAACALALACAYLLKRQYATADAGQLRWILAPTAALVETMTGASFEFEAGSGYLCRKRMFLIAPGCAGVNFLIASFLMATILLSARIRAHTALLSSAALAYATTLTANAVRISLAIYTVSAKPVLAHLDGERIHRLEGIVVYFSFLLLLFLAVDGAEPSKHRVRSRLLIPLLVYYGVVLGIPLANGALSRSGPVLEHLLFSLLVPPVLLLLCATFARKHAPA